MITNSIVIPVYKNAESIPQLLSELEAVANKIGHCELVFVVDGSPDLSFDILREKLAALKTASQLVSLSRNFGSFQAIMCGLFVAKGQFFSVISADLQESPSILIDFFSPLHSGRFDVVLGQRQRREDPFMSKIFSAGFWRLYQLIIDSSMPKGGVDIFSCNQKVRDNLVSFKESNSSLVSLLFWLGYRRTFAPYERKARLHGKSAWTFSKKLRYLNNTMYGFTDFPIRLITWAGSFVSILSLCLMLVVFVAKIFGFIDPPGYTTIILLISFFGASNIVAIGIVGGYIYRCFENTKARPLFVIQHQESFRID